MKNTKTMENTKIMKNMIAVKIKEWDKMAEEFGVSNYYGDMIINTDYSFTEYMEKIIPKSRIIVVEDDENSEHYWCPKINIDFIITKDMIEEYLDEKDYPEYFI